MPPKPRNRASSSLKENKPPPPPGPSPRQKQESLEIKDALNTEDEEDKFWKILVIFGKLKIIKEKAEAQTPLDSGTRIFAQYTYSELNEMVEELDRILSEYQTAIERSSEMVEKITSPDSEFSPAENAKFFSDISKLKQRAIGVFTEVFGASAEVRGGQKAGGYKKRSQKSRKSKKKLRRKNKSKRKKRTKGKRSKRRSKRK